MTIDELAKTIYITGFNFNGLKSLLEIEFAERYTKQEIIEYVAYLFNRTAGKGQNLDAWLNDFDAWIKQYRKEKTNGKN